MIRFGYGMAHFPALRNEGRWYVDRTRFIRMLEDAVKTPVFCAHAVLAKAYGSVP